MINGGKPAKEPSSKIKRLGDLIPKDDPRLSLPTIHDFLNVDLTITKIDSYVDSRGQERGLVITFIYKGGTTTLKITQTKLVDKLNIVKHQLPVVAKITKGDRYFDIG